MTYVVSDIHGSYEKFKGLLKKIGFGDNDTMYVIGDIVDYGEDSIELLCDLSMRYNVIPIVGDHDLSALRLLKVLDRMLSSGERPDAATLAEMTEWMREGGQKTMEDFKSLDKDMKEGVLEYLEDMSLYEELQIKGKKYVLVHAGIAGYDPKRDMSDYEPSELIYRLPSESLPTLPDATLIVGHIPTYSISGAEKGRIYRKDGVIYLDCGAAFGEPLACLRLEDDKEFYVYD